VSAVADGMPGYTYEIHDQLAQGDLVVNRLTWRGVHSATMAGVPATSRSVEMGGINMFCVRDGQVVEQWAEIDMLGLLQQIGAIPTWITARQKKLAPVPAERVLFGLPGPSGRERNRARVAMARSADKTPKPTVAGSST
jgi:hypothetical protein